MTRSTPIKRANNSYLLSIKYSLHVTYNTARKCLYNRIITLISVEFLSFFKNAVFPVFIRFLRGFALLKKRLKTTKINSVAYTLHTIRHKKRAGISPRLPCRRNSYGYKAQNFPYIALCAKSIFRLVALFLVCFEGFACFL